MLENEIFIKANQWTPLLEAAKQQVADYIQFLQRQNKGILAENMQNYYREVLCSLAIAAYAAPVTAAEMAGTAVMAASGETMLVFGVSESAAGVSNIQLARQGDIETEAFNPLMTAIPYLKENPEVCYGIMQGSVIVNSVATVESGYITWKG